MKVLVTGHNGYLGGALTPTLAAAGHELTGLDRYFYDACTYGEPTPDIASTRSDIRDVGRGFVAVLAADRALVHGQAFNVVSTSQSYRIRDPPRAASGKSCRGGRRAMARSRSHRW